MMDTRRPADRRTMIGGTVPNELDVAFGVLLLHEPDLVEQLLALDDLFVDG